MAKISVSKTQHSHSIDVVSAEFTQILFGVVNLYEERLAAMEETMKRALDEALGARQSPTCLHCSVPFRVPRDAPNRR